MPSHIILTSTNYIGNVTFYYKFRSEMKCPDDIAGVAMSNISFYNNTFNISSNYGNNTLTLNWLGTNYTMIFPNGYYGASGINAFFQSFCYQNNLYMTSNSGNNTVYFIECVTNSVQYALQLDMYAIPTAAQATALGYTLPSGATWSLPATASTPQLTIPAAFGSLLGLSAGTYPSTVQTSTQNFISTTTPIISPVNTYVFTISLINNPYANTLNQVLSAVPLTASFGSLVSYSPPNTVFQDIYAGKYTDMTIKVFDQNMSPLQLNDSEFVINLAFATPREMLNLGIKK